MVHSVEDAILHGWHKFNSSSTVLIFVHGLFSDSEKCWKSKTNVYWPDLLYSDTRLGQPSIFLLNYYTKPLSADYGIRNCAEEVFGMLQRLDDQGREAPLKRKNLIFIAHSTGGVVVRYMLEANCESFSDKNIGLCLYASPSIGSKWPKFINQITSIFNNSLVSPTV